MTDKNAIISKGILKKWMPVGNRKYDIAKTIEQVLANQEKLNASDEKYLYIGNGRGIGIGYKNPNRIKTGLFKKYTADGDGYGKGTSGGSILPPEMMIGMVHI